MFGLTNQANSHVGSPGLTKDERHRLTAAETVVGAYPVLVFDHISELYDGPSTFRTLAMLKEYAHVRQTVVVCSLQWPTQDVFNLFDCVIVLNSGRVVYQGPTACSTSYFVDLGYESYISEGAVVYML
ncbi:unnamed protein product [Closterium sp. NIES-53]